MSASAISLISALANFGAGIVVGSIVAGVIMLLRSGSDAVNLQEDEAADSNLVAVRRALDAAQAQILCALARRAELRVLLSTLEARDPKSRKQA